MARLEPSLHPRNKPDGANRRQPLDFREFVGEPGVLAFTATVAHPFRSHVVRMTKGVDRRNVAVRSWQVAGSFWNVPSPRFMGLIRKSRAPLKDESDAHCTSLGWADDLAARFGMGNRGLNDAVMRYDFKLAAQMPVRECAIV